MDRKASGGTIQLCLSFAVVGDTQIINDDYPDDFPKIYDYILGNQQSKNIQIVLGMGDIVNNNHISEWVRAQEQFSRIQQAGLPHIPIRGNHDNGTSYNAFITEFVENEIDGSYSKWNIYNTYQIHTIHGIPYLFLALDYGPSDTVLEWANTVCEQYPDHNVVLLTHLYLNRKGNLAGMSSTEEEYRAKNCGEDIWNKLVSKQDNIVMVLSGHISDNGIVHNTRTRENGTSVLEMLIDPQGLDAEDVPTGLVAMLYFNRDATQVTAQYFSTIQQKFYGESFTTDVRNVSPPPTPPIWPWIALGIGVVVAITVALVLMLRRKKTTDAFGASC